MTEISEIKSLLRANDFSEIMNLLNLIHEKKSQESLILVNQLSEKGTNIKEFTNSILKTLRQIMLAKNGIVEPIKSELGTSKWEEVKGFADKSEMSLIVSYIENFQAILEQLKFTSLPVLPLEVAAVKSISQLTVDNDQLSVGKQQQSVIQSEQSERRNPEDRQGASSAYLIKIATPLDEARNDVVQQVESKEIPSVETLQTSDDVIVITDKWTYILETIRPYNYSLEALLKQAKVVNYDGTSVILEVPYSFHQRILESPKSRSLLESVLADVLGKSVKVSTVLGKREISTSELANVEVAQDDEIIKIASEIFNS